MKKRITIDEKLKRAEIAYELSTGGKFNHVEIGRILSISRSRVDQIVWWYRFFVLEEDL